MSVPNGGKSVISRARRLTTTTVAPPAPRPVMNRPAYIILNLPHETVYFTSAITLSSIPIMNLFTKSHSVI